MVRLGFVFDNFMVNLRPRIRRARAVASASWPASRAWTRSAAAQALARHGDIKHAVLGLAGLTQTEADTVLVHARGNMRVALSEVSSRRRAEP